MSSAARQPLPAIHPAHWAAIEDQVQRLMDVRSVLDCAKCALLNDDAVEVVGSVTMARVVVDDVIDKFDSVSLAATTEKWLATRERQAKND